MKVFLNGISISDFQLAWRVTGDVEPTTPLDTENDSKGIWANDLPKKQLDCRRIILENKLQQSFGEDLVIFNDYWWRYAYANTPDLIPPRHLLQIVDRSNIGIGYALTAKQFIPSGTILYTERALFACQVPENAATTADHHQLRTDRHQPSLFKVCACQNCFRSLEPISSCCIAPSTKDEDSGFIAPFPLPHLYPVHDFRWDSSPPAGSLPYAVDHHGRITCFRCNTLFCSLQCYDAFQDQYSSCCLLLQTMQHLPSLFRQRLDVVQENFANQQCCDIGGSSEIDYDDDFVSIQPAIPLAIRMFVAMLQCCRTNRLSPNSVSSEPLFNIINDLCGTSSDIQKLELGIPQAMRVAKDETLSILYTLEPIYLYLVDLYSMTIDERQNRFSLEYFTSVTAKAARNSFGLRTQSPFQTYYAGIVRTHYDRKSDAHRLVQRALAMALGSTTGWLERGMDQKVNDHVSPEIAAFYPLTSRINHSCSPNAEVRSQQFVDSCIDLVAKVDITAGSEICISYIHIGRKRTGRRQRELFAKYIFQCNCSLCVLPSSA
jgi:SET domain